jgi:aminodeoxychorismate synthase component I
VLLPSTTAHALREIARAPDPLALFARLRTGGSSWLLESALPDPRLARFHFLGADPWCIARVRGRRLELELRRAPDGSAAYGVVHYEGDPFAWLRGLLPRPPDPPPAGTPRIPFLGGLVGWLGYELAQHCDGVALHGRDDLGLPDALLLGVDRCVAIERATGRAWLSALGMGDDLASARSRAQAGLDALERAVESPPPPDPPAARGHAGVARAFAVRAPDLDAGAYAKAVDAILDEIAAGNVYQACLTQRVERPYGGDALALYRALRRINPAPFAACLELPEVAVVGSSPERFLSVSADGEVESRPIKGTRPRGATPEEDARLRAELLASPKERAENVMIVDLVRNDLGRVCALGSIHVPELYTVEAYASVFQLVSTVRGRLAPGCDAFDAVRACFPPGSMTGAPKRAAMQLLDRLETWRRGIYAGALGWFDVRGGADLCVVIRSAFLRDGRACLHAGGGVVADSRPFAEHAEAEEKLLPLLRALEEAEDATRRSRSSQ